MLSPVLGRSSGSGTYGGVDGVMLPISAQDFHADCFMNYRDVGDILKPLLMGDHPVMTERRQ